MAQQQPKNLQKMIEQERKEWASLVDIGTNGKLVDFWKAYTKYLDDRDYMSPGRKFLRDMAVKTYKELESVVRTH
jgi:hypothetical protein